MPTISQDIDIALPVRAVYNQWTQFEGYPAFMTDVQQVRQLDDSHLYWAISVAGVDRGFEAEITEQIPDERIAWKSTSGPDNAGVVTFHRLDDNRTRVRLQIEWEPEGFVESVGAAFKVDNARVAAALSRFAELMESNGFATGAWRGRIE